MIIFAPYYYKIQELSDDVKRGLYLESGRAMKIVNSDGLDKWTYLNNKYKSSYMLKRVFLEILKGSTGFEPMIVRDTSPYPVRYHFA